MKHLPGVSELKLNTYSQQKSEIEPRIGTETYIKTAMLSII